MLLSPPGDLDCVVAVGRLGPNLAHCAGTQLDHGYCAHAARGVNRLSHPDFLANHSTQHFVHRSRSALASAFSLV